MSCLSSVGIGGRPGRDFHLQRSLKPARCQRIRVCGRTTTSAERHWNSRDSNAKLARVEQIKKFHIIEGDWEPGGEELTPTMKLKRKPIDQKYSDVIEDLYSGPRE